MWRLRWRTPSRPDAAIRAALMKKRPSGRFFIWPIGSVFRLHMDVGIDKKNFVFSAIRYEELTRFD